MKAVYYEKFGQRPTVETPPELISEIISLAQAADALADFDSHPQVGVTVISDFS